MSLRYGVFAGWIAGLSLFGDDLSLTRNAALKLRSHFLAASLFEGIGATAHERRARDCERDQQGPHPLILGINYQKQMDRINRIYKAKEQRPDSGKSCPSGKSCLAFCFR